VACRFASGQATRGRAPITVQTAFSLGPAHPTPCQNHRQEKQAALRILAMNLDTNTPTGRLLLNLVGSVAQFEREIMLERQREGVAKAKGEGKYRGRAPTARAKSADVIAEFKASRRPTDIAKSIGIGRASVYRILNDAGLVNGQRASIAGGRTTA
jgi:DNA invertase Pin-like site-specific DNA recombinase